MLDFLVVFILIISILFGVISGDMSRVSQAAIKSCSNAVELAVFLMGTMALWCGIMRLADKSGLTAKISRLISPITNRLLPDIGSDPNAQNNVTMNIASNLLGLGNAATALGIKAITAIDASFSAYKERNLAVFTVLNTASIQLLPTTAASIRLAHGSAKPFEIIAPVLITSLISVTVGCLTAYILYLPKKVKI